MSEFGISEVTYYALAKEVRREGPSTALQPDVEAVQDIAEAHLGARPTTQDLIQAGGQQYIDVLPRWHTMWADAMLLRNHAVDAEGRLLDPDLLQRSVQRRQQLLESISSITVSLFNIRQIQDFWDTVVEEITEVDRETAKRIIERLENLAIQIGVKADPRYREAPEAENSCWCLVIGSSECGSGGSTVQSVLGRSGRRRGRRFWIRSVVRSLYAAAGSPAGQATPSRHARRFRQE
jgi:hypothetical protein